MPILRWAKPRKGYHNILQQYAHKTTSSNGEDGIIDHIVTQLSIDKGFCVEVGAWDGLVGSNSWRLLNEGSWSGLLIEADKEKYKELERRYKKLDRVYTSQSFVSWDGPNSLDHIFKAYDVPVNFELLCIDIDGNDYHVWESLTSFRPRIVVIEFNNHIPNDIEYVQDADFSINRGASLRSMILLGKSKGYELAATCGCNAFFVDANDYPLLGIENNAIDAMFDDTRTETKIFQLYDGSFAVTGKQLNWLKRDFTQEDLQILPPEERVYGKRLQPEISLDVQDYESSLHEGEELFGKGKVLEAEYVFSDLIEQFPDRHSPYNNLGVICFARQEYAKAERFLSTGFELCSTDSDLVYNYMVLLMQMNKFVEAAQVGYKHIADGGDEDRIRYLLSRLPKKVHPTLDISVVPAVQLQEHLGLSEPSASLEESCNTPLDKWKMEVNDAPIFRYLYRNFRPQRHLEFGTWQGAGVVYCLEECDATVWTINLPFGEDKSDGDSAYAGDGDSFGLGTTLADSWAERLGLPQQDAYRTDSFGFIGRFYLEKQLGHRVCQIYSDSTKWDSSNYPEGFFDSVLVDGGHMPEVVLSDTRKALKLLRPGGLIMWHDFCPPVKDKFEVVQGVMSGIELAAPMLSTSLEKLFWIQPSWILVGIKR